MSRKRPMGFEFDLADICECDECEEEVEDTDVGQGHHESTDRVYSPQEMAEAFYALVVKLRALGAKEVAAFEMATTFEAAAPKPATRKKAAK